MSYESFGRGSARNTHEKKTTYTRRDHQEAEGGRNHAQCGEERRGSVPRAGGEPRDVSAMEERVWRDAHERLKAAQGA